MSVDFSVILQDKVVRRVVQGGILERAFHDALVPRQLFRSEAFRIPWPANVGDSMIFTSDGLMEVDCEPLRPGDEPEDGTYPIEQWEATLRPYAKSIPTHMPTSMVAIANLFLRNAKKLGIHAGMTLNRIVRNAQYRAALSGHTVADGAQSGTSLRVIRMNGFTRARRPDLAAGSPVRFDLVSASNPLPVKLFDNGSETDNTITGFTPDIPGDEVGPGVLTLGTAATSVADRDYLLSVDRTDLVRVGGGLSVDALTPGTDIPTLADIRAAVADFRQNSVPEHPDGRFHVHLDPTSESLIFSDSEFQRLLTALPDYYMYKRFALGELLGCVFFLNNEVPVPTTVVGGTAGTFNIKDPFSGELYKDGATSDVVHRMLFTAQGGILEYYLDLAGEITEAGVTGAVGEPSVTNNGIMIDTTGVTLIIRAPLDKLQEIVTSSWKLKADWPLRTDATTGSPARYKRTKVIEHSE